jgi:hypothetical protein
LDWQDMGPVHDIGDLGIPKLEQKIIVSNPLNFTVPVDALSNKDRRNDYADRGCDFGYRRPFFQTEFAQQCANLSEYDSDSVIAGFFTRCLTVWIMRCLSMDAPPAAGSQSVQLVNLVSIA